PFTLSVIDFLLVTWVRLGVIGCGSPAGGKERNGDAGAVRRALDHSGSGQLQCRDSAGKADGPGAVGACRVGYEFRLRGCVGGVTQSCCGVQEFVTVTA